MSTLFGWTLREWGIAINRLDFRPTTLEQALNMREQWDRQYNTKPGEVQIIGGDYSADLHHAGNLWRVAAKAGGLQ